MANNRIVWKEYTNGLYPVSLFVGCTNYLDDIQNTFSYTDGSEIEDISRYCLAATISAVKKDTNERCVVIVFRDKRNAKSSVIAHEAYHATDFMCSFLGIEYNPTGSNEAQAYLHGWIVKCCNMTLKGKEE